MFDSGIKASDLIEQVKDEADIALTIPDTSYVLWLNELEQLLYTELIQEQGKIELGGVNGDIIPIDTLNVPNGENTVRFEDIHAIYADSTQLIKSTVASGVIFPNTYYKKGCDIGINLIEPPEKVLVVYFVKPELKTVDNLNATDVMVPIEFVDLVTAKLRGEAYKVANEDSLAAKWLNDYNILLETFKAWLSVKRPEFGL